MVWVFVCIKPLYGKPKRRLLSDLVFFHELIKIFLTLIIPQWLSWCGVSLLVNWLSIKWDYTSTESMQSQTLLQLNQISHIYCSKFYHFLKILLNLRIDSINTESHSMLALSLWSLTQHWLSWPKVKFHVDSVCRIKISQWGLKLPNWTISDAFRGKEFWEKKKPRNVPMSLRATRKNIIFYLAYRKKIYSGIS